MRQSVLVESHESLFLQQGWLLGLHFSEGWACLRIVDLEWANLQPWSLGAVVAGGNLADYDQVQDANANHYLEPYSQSLIYHSFWGVTPASARIFVQYPGRTDLGSILSAPRILTGDIGSIDGHTSPFWGPYSKKTELFTVKERYPQFQALDPTGDAFANVMVNFDQRHYTYQIITDRALIKDMLVGSRTVKKYTMGPASSKTMTMPDWLQKAVTDPLLTYSLNVMAGKA